MSIENYNKVKQLCAIFHLSPRVQVPSPTSTDGVIKIRLKGPGTGFTGDTELLYKNISKMLLELYNQALLTDINLSVAEDAFRELELDGKTGSQCAVAFGVTMDKRPNVRGGEIDLIVKRRVLEAIETNLDFDFINPFDP